MMIQVILNNGAHIVAKQDRCQGKLPVFARSE
jgi:hypothetical protein